MFEKAEFGKIQLSGKPYFVANDVAKALGYVEAAKAVGTHCKGVSDGHTFKRRYSKDENNS